MNPVNINGSPSGIKTTQPTKVDKQNPEPARTADSSSAGSVSTPKDQVTVSSRAEEISRMVARANQSSAIRHDRVEHLRKLVHSHKYSVSSNDIADAIMRDEK